jgi:broad specificity phosphatase PhoE
MTADQMIGHFRAAGLQVMEPKQVSKQITEYMREDWFGKYPLDSLIFDTPHLAKYVSPAGWKQEELDQPHPCPENYVMFHNRIGKYRSKLAFPRDGECLLLVTHGFVVR